MAKPSARNRQVVRTWSVLHLIGESPRTIDDLAQDLGVTTRTIRRDIEALEEAGFPLYSDKHDDGKTRWRPVRAAAAAARTAGLTEARLALRFADVPAVLTFVELLHKETGALHARLREAAA